MQNSEETTIELDTDGQSVDIELESSPDDSEDQFSRAETSTQKRIDRLTKKMREAERREQEAVKYAQAVQSEANNLKQRVNVLDTSYVNEYSNRVNTEINQAGSGICPRH
jgi:hypothetical protein